MLTNLLPVALRSLPNDTLRKYFIKVLPSYLQLIIIVSSQSWNPWEPSIFSGWPPDSKTLQTVPRCLDWAAAKEWYSNSKAYKDKNRDSEKLQALIIR